jgi:hypothetical protein
MRNRDWGALALLALAGCAGAGDPRERTERQIEELYRPLLALVKESRASVQAYLKELGRDYIFPTDREMTEAERTSWLAKAEGDLMPRNDRMCALIRAKGDLVEGGALPASWQALLEHQDAWNALHRAWKAQGKAYPWRSPSPFPRTLERELERDLKRLEERAGEAARGAPPPR